MCHPQWVNGAAVKEIKSVSLAFFRVCLELLDMQLACDNWKSREWEWGWGCGWWWGIPESGGRELADRFIISLNYYQSDSVRGTALAKLINNQNKSIHSLGARNVKNRNEQIAIATLSLQILFFTLDLHFKLKRLTKTKTETQNRTEKRSLKTETQLVDGGKNREKIYVCIRNTKFPAGGHEKCKTNWATLSGGQSWDCCRDLGHVQH